MRLTTGTSFLAFGLSLLLLILPLASSSAIPASASSHALHKRWYTFRWASKALYRSYGTVGVKLTCNNTPGEAFEPGLIRDESQYFNWPWSLRGKPLKVVRRMWRCRSDTIVAWDEWDEFPKNEEDLANLLVSEGSSWNPPIDKNEAYRAMHAVDPQEFPHKDYNAKVQAQLNALTTKLSAAVNNFAASSAPIVPGVSKNCKKFHKAKGGDSCYWIAKNNGVTLAKFYQWNKKVNEGGECSQLWVGYRYCVGF
ncbi:hypothetical protein BJ508DRAFT_418988 [Ascobolus immersus RN42]|uniref:LysM domain-containing protein n=1 Tax=Ascobolus immersus RN42 TaxID=1160509 RepID=A0A3N4HHW8_ASCIM|nr:hypothetical protein BJ508DRAFT_418988 [Ascobolus immersus RN42]